MTEELLRVRGLCVNFKLKNKLFGKPDLISAVHDLSFSINRGQSLGIVGESGCGKTTLANAIFGLLKPDSGEIFYKGRDLLKLSGPEFRALRTRMQMIFQDPSSSLNPRFRVWELIGEPLYIQGERNPEKIRARAGELLRLVGLSDEDLDRRAVDFSGGQRQRIVIARALALKPSFLVCDEPLSALDVSVHAQICKLLQDLRKELNLTYLLISHDLGAVRYMTEQMAVMYLGHIVEYGATEQIFRRPCHPYTQALLSAALDIHAGTPGPKLLKGEAASPVNVAPGCRFASRCDYTGPECPGESLVEVEPGHVSLCGRALPS
jgi:oligopeptide/dipeptide ABC transporter ATP-binding protein